MSIPATIRDLVSSKSLSLCLLTQTGSKAYGIDVRGSDNDYAGIFIANLRQLLSIQGPEQNTYSANAPDYTLHEIGKFCHLALKGNPAILEMLWNPNVLVSDRWGKALVGLRDRMIHRGSLTVYVEYAESQLKKMVRGKGLHAKGGAYNGKYGAHLIRLLHAGLSLARTGQVMVKVPEDLAVALLAIRSGEESMERVLERARPLLSELKDLREGNMLPPKPDREAVNDLVIEARLSRKDA